MPWTDSNDDILLHLICATKYYEYLHKRSARRHKIFYDVCSLPVVILGFCIGTYLLIAPSIPKDQTKSIGSYCAGALDICTGALACITYLQKFPAAIVLCMRSTTKYSALRNRLEAEHMEKNRGGDDYIIRMMMEFEAILQDSPNIPDSIMMDLDRKFKNDDPKYEQMRTSIMRRTFRSNRIREWIMNTNEHILSVISSNEQL